jgi:hypothetical protein
MLLSGGLRIVRTDAQTTDDLVGFRFQSARPTNRNRMAAV